MSTRKPPHHSLTGPRAWFDIFWNKRGWIPMIACAVLLVATFVAFVNYRTAERFDREGLWTQAEVVGKRVKRGEDSDTYILKLRFETTRGRAQSVEHNVARRDYRDTAMGSERPIRYLPSRPSKTELEEGATYNVGWWAQIVALVAGVVGLGSLWIIGSDTNRAVKARRHGALQLARVERFVEHKNSDGPTGKGYMIWRLDDGTRGESLSQDLYRLRRIGVGGRINVYVRDGDSVWEGDVGPRPERESSFPKVD